MLHNRLNNLYIADFNKTHYEEIPLEMRRTLIKKGDHVLVLRVKVTSKGRVVEDVQAFQAQVSRCTRFMYLDYRETPLGEAIRLKFPFHFYGLLYRWTQDRPPALIPTEELSNLVFWQDEIQKLLFF